MIISLLASLAMNRAYSCSVIYVYVYVCYVRGTITVSCNKYYVCALDTFSLLYLSPAHLFFYVCSKPVLLTVMNCWPLSVWFEDDMVQVYSVGCVCYLVSVCYMRHICYVISLCDMSSISYVADVGYVCTLGFDCLGTWFGILHASTYPASPVNTFHFISVVIYEFIWTKLTKRAVSLCTLACIYITKKAVPAYLNSTSQSVSNE